MTYTIFPLKIIRNNEIIKTINYPTLAAVAHFVYKMDKDAEIINLNMYVNTTPYAVYYNKNTNTIYTTAETDATKKDCILAHSNILKGKDKERYLNHYLEKGVITLEDLTN